MLYLYVDGNGPQPFLLLTNLQEEGEEIDEINVVDIK
jgi:hypothetical protein